MAVDGSYFTADAIWSLGTIAAVAVALFYASSLSRQFKGGKLENGHRYLLYSFAVLLVAFIARLILDLIQVQPVTAFGVSVRDVGVVVAMVFIAASLGQISRVWRNP
jgi:hypothetical protein